VALGLTSVAALRLSHGEWISEALGAEAQPREEFRTQNVAVGSAAFVRQTQGTIGLKGNAIFSKMARLSCSARQREIMRLILKPKIDR